MSNQQGDALEVIEKHATDLVQHLQSGNYADALGLMDEIIGHREQLLFEEIGKLTRAMHEAIIEFQIDIASKSGVSEDKESELSDASKRLNYVMGLTESAANKTMDMVEACTPIAARMGEESDSLHTEWRRLKKRELKPGEFRELYSRIDEFLESTRGQAEELHQSLSNILMAQDYQDLTGQVIKRVITLVTEVESSLVNLVRMAGNVEDVAGIEGERPAAKSKPHGTGIEGEGPQIDSTRANVVSGQDEVDDLLSSLGF